jgi:hypothetical protein
MRKEAIKTADLRVNDFVVSGLICTIEIDGIIAGICLHVRFMALRLGCLATIVLCRPRAAGGRPLAGLEDVEQILTAHQG